MSGKVTKYSYMLHTQNIMKLSTYRHKHASYWNNYLHNLWKQISAIFAKSL